MTFADTLLATLIGALVGAVVGAFASWMFALDLKRRAAVEAQHARLDKAVAAVIRLLGDLDGSAQAFAFSAAYRSPVVPASLPHLPRQQLLSAILVARMASGDEEGPLLAVYEFVAQPHDERSGRRDVDHKNFARVLMEWRRGMISAKDATSQITASSAVVREHS